MNNEWQSDPVFPFEIHQLEQKKKILPKDSCYHILYVNRGRILNKKKEGFIIYTQRGFLIIPPLQGPGIRLDSETRGYEIIISRILLSELTVKVMDRGLLSFSEKEVSFFSVKEREEDMFGRIIENLLMEWKNKKTGFRDIIRLKLIELFINLARLENVATPGSGRVIEDLIGVNTGNNTRIDIHTTSKKIADILTYLEKTYYQSLSLDELAGETGFSPSYLSRYFKNQTGMCLFEYINRLRIRRACLLLKRTNKKIIEIAYEVGYNNISFFNRYFKKTLNISPMEYRKKMKM